MNLRGTKQLVIGGAGFIGSHLVEQLLTSDVAEVVVFDNFASGKPENLAEALKDSRCRLAEGSCDIRDANALAQAMQGMDGVFHLAALWLLHCRDHPREAFEVNIEGTFNVLEACVGTDIKRLIFSSSASVYGDAEELPMTEKHPFNNRNFYGATKISGESMCRAFHDRYGLDYVGLRYMNVYGPRQNLHKAYAGVIPSLLQRVDAGEPPVINGDGTQAYDFVHVSDVARANRLAMEAEVSDECINVGTGVPTCIRDLAELLLGEIGSELKPIYQPYTEADARQLVQHRIGCPRRAEELIQFRHAMPLREGLQTVVEWNNDVEVAYACGSR
jgi:UDP-glucose 4-epimerase